MDAPVDYVEVPKYGYCYSWPFKNMEVGDVLIFSPEMGPHARAAAYNYGRSTGKRFVAKGRLGSPLRVERVVVYGVVTKASPEQFERATQLADARRR